MDKPLTLQDLAELYLELEQRISDMERAYQERFGVLDGRDEHGS